MKVTILATFLAFIGMTNNAFSNVEAQRESNTQGRYAGMENKSEAHKLNEDETHLYRVCNMNWNGSSCKQAHDALTCSF